MKKIIGTSAIALFLVLAALLSFCRIAVDRGLYAAGLYDFSFSEYYVEYDINADLTMSVTEQYTIHYTGSQSTGFMRDIPVNDGDRVRNIKAYEIIGDSAEKVDYTVNNEYSGFITVDIGDRTNKTGELHTYRVTYDYAVTEPAAKDTLYLNAIGFGSEADMRNVTVILNLPSGIKDAKCYTKYGMTTTDDFTQNGNVIEYTSPLLRSGTGVSFELNFESGVLSTKPDITPYIVIIAGCVLLAVVIAVKLLKFNHGDITVIPNFDACDKYDPLIMGKLLDNAADNEDITSLIYYFADKGYLKIDVSDPDETALIRLVKELPPDVPPYQNLMFVRLFGASDIVKVNDLKNSFYTTVDNVRKQANAAALHIYDKKSMLVAAAFALAGALVMGLAPMLIGMFTINMTFLYFLPLAAVIPAGVIFFLTKMARERAFKYTKTMTVLMYAGIVLLCAAFTAAYTWFVASYVVETVPKILLCAVGFAIVAISSFIISRTPEYERQLGEILGFKDFIENVEKDKLETMLEGNPELYYKVLPYAQVLGVSNIWEEKFKALTVAPPQWAVGYDMSDVFNIVLFTSVLRTVNTNMAKAFVSRPSSKGLSGGGIGHFGGFGGGGHGGGGFRGR